jgi:lipoyl(octanoyl) transferase
MSDALSFEWLGHQPYEPILHQLKARAAAVASGEESEIIWACEHEPVYTTGRRAVDNRKQAELPAPLIHTNRGGETTFHGTGQLMFYPIIHLKKRQLSPKNYVHLLEQSAIDLLAEMEINAQRQCGLPGVWTDEGKIAAIGLRIENGVAYHGMALNVDVAASWFAVINPCGTGKKSVSMSQYIDTWPNLGWLADKWNGQLTRLL